MAAEQTCAATQWVLEGCRTDVWRACTADVGEIQPQSCRPATCCADDGRCVHVHVLFGAVHSQDLLLDRRRVYKTLMVGSSASSRDLLVRSVHGQLDTALQARCRTHAVEGLPCANCCKQPSPIACADMWKVLRAHGFECLVILRRTTTFPYPGISWSIGSQHLHQVGAKLVCMHGCMFPMGKQAAVSTQHLIC
jgi:hypothetical protein